MVGPGGHRGSRGPELQGAREDGEGRVVGRDVPSGSAKARLSRTHLRQRAGRLPPLTPILWAGLWSPLKPNSFKSAGL